MSNPWRYACPEGHRSIQNRANGRYWCQMCEELVNKVDMKTGQVVA